MKLKVVAIALLASTSFASAADLAARPYTKAPVAPAAYSWAGFYIGAMGGYAWSNEVTSGLTGGAAVTTSSDDLKGGFGGGTIGYNWHTPGSQFVFGIEVDAAGAAINYSETSLGLTLSTKIQSLGSVTGRAGFAVNNALFYGKGGYAWANNKLSGTALGVTISDTQFHNGWTVGAGVEYGFAPGWSAKAEYMYADFDKQSYFNAVDLGMSLHTFKGGINYRFGAY